MALKTFNKEMLCGALWCVGGILVLALSWATTSEHSIRLLWWTAVLCGAVPFLLRSKLFAL
jgi:hypothetical protein